MAVTSSTNISPSQDCFCSSDNLGILKLFKNSFPFSLSSSVTFDLYSYGKSVFVRSVSQKDQM